MARAKIKAEYDIPISKMSNTISKTAAIIICDISESTGWNGANKAINDGIGVFVQTLKDDKFGSESIDLAVLEFNHNSNVNVDFTPIKDLDNIRVSEPSGGTDINQAVLDGIKYLEKQEQAYKSNKIKFKAPWMFLITDGQSQYDITEAAKITNSKISNKQLTMITVGAGTDVDTVELNKFDDTRPVIFSPNADDLKPLFEWLSHVSLAVGKSMKGEKVTVKPLDNRYEFIS